MMQRSALKFTIGIIIDDEEEYKNLMDTFSRILWKKEGNCFIYSKRRPFVDVVFNVCLYKLTDEITDELDSQLFIFKHPNSIFYLEEYLSTNVLRVLVYLGEIRSGILDFFLGLEIPVIIIKDDEKELINIFKKFVSLTVSQRISKEKFEEIYAFFRTLSIKTLKELIKKEKEEIEEKAQKLGLKTPLEKFFLAMREEKIHIAKEYLNQFIRLDMERKTQISDIYSLTLSLVPEEREKKIEFEIKFRTLLFESLKIRDGVLRDVVSKFLFTADELERFLDTILMEFNLKEKLENLLVRYFLDPRIAGFSKEIYVRRREEYYEIFSKFSKQDERKIFVIVGDAGIGKTWFLADLAFSNRKIIPLKTSNPPEYELKVVGEMSKNYFLLVDSLESAKDLDDWLNLLTKMVGKTKIIIGCRLNDWMHRREIVRIREELSNEIYPEGEYSLLVEPFNDDEFKKVREKFKVQDRNALRIPFILGEFLRSGRLDRKTMIKALSRIGLTEGEIKIIREIVKRLKVEKIHPGALMDEIGRENFRRIMSSGIFYVEKSGGELTISLKKHFEWIREVIN